MGEGELWSRAHELSISMASERYGDVSVEAKSLVLCYSI